MNKTTKKRLLEICFEESEKYTDLVWFARVKEENLQIEAVVKSYLRVMANYPFEVDLLQEESLGDFHHGFNSGCLAAFRYMITCMSEGEVEAIEMFPELDT